MGVCREATILAVFLFFVRLNSQPNENEKKPPVGLLDKMLKSSGFGAIPPPRAVPMRYKLTDAESLKFANLTNMERFNETLKPLLTPRVVGTAEHKAVGDFLIEKMQKMNFNVTEDKFSARTPMGRKNFRNLIGTLDPNAEKRMVLACHYDSKILENDTFIGAVDSAVPCAMILDLAESLLPYLNKTMNTTLQLLFLDGEEAFVEWSREDSLYGARHLAKQWSQRSAPKNLSELDRISAFLLLDLLGTANPLITHSNGHGTEHLFRRIVKIERTLRKAGALKETPNIFFNFDLPTSIEDDHIPFHERRVPVMHLISFIFPSTWHTAADNADSLHPPTIYNLLTVIRVFVAAYLGLSSGD